MQNHSRGWFSLTAAAADSDDEEDDDDGGGAAVCSPAPELFSKLASLPDFLKHQLHEKPQETPTMELAGYSSHSWPPEKAIFFRQSNR